MHPASILLVAACLTLLALLVLLKTPLSKFALDKPNHRSLHKNTIPRTGGIAIMGGTLAGLYLVGGFNLFGIYLIALLSISFADDILDISAVIRLIAQLIVCVCFVLQMGVSGAFASFLVFSLVWMTNLYNFMDGSDGLAGGMTVFGFGAYAIAALHGHDAQIVMVSAIVACTSLIFLIFNFHPARIFMGDAGSIPLGFLAGALGFYGWQQGLWSWWFPLLVFSPFVVDASITLFKRLLRGEKPWEAHRSHYYQKLVQMGLGHRRTALYEYGLMLSTATTALSIQLATIQTVAFALAAWMVIYLILMLQIDKRWSQL